MICDDARPLLDPLYDGVLNSRDTALVLEHVKNCVTCGQQWHEMDKLRTRFHSARNATIIPEGLTKRIEANLNKEEKIRRSVFVGRRLGTMPRWLIAAGILLVGFLVLPNYLQHPAVEHAEVLAVNTMIDDFNDGRLVKRIGSDRALSQSLGKSLGFEPKFIKMPGWNLEQASVYRSPYQWNMARFDFTSTRYGEKLYCFQAKAGGMSMDAVEPTNVAGKSVRFGRHGKFQFALWSQNDRDYLLLTPLSKEALTEIVSNA